jgi:hypothetical protein
MARLRAYSRVEGRHLSGIQSLLMMLGLAVILGLTCKLFPMRDKSEKMRKNMVFVETLHKAGIPSDKITKIIYDNSFLDGESEQTRKLNDAIADEMAQKLYRIFISKKNISHFTSLFVFVTEYSGCLEREFFLFRYFLISFFGEIYIGSGRTYNKIMEIFNGFIAEWKSKETRFDGYGGEEFLSLAAARKIQYRQNIPKNFDNSSLEDVSKFIAGASGIVLNGADIERSLCGEDFYSYLPVSLNKEYFDTRAKMFGR